MVAVEAEVVVPWLVATALEAAEVEVGALRAEVVVVVAERHLMAEAAVVAAVPPLAVVVEGVCSTAAEVVAVPSWAAEAVVAGETRWLAHSAEDQRSSW